MTPAWLRYTNQGAIRDDALSPKLVNALSFLPNMGLSMEVFSGGQENNTTHGTGSTRHNHGDAADVFFYKDGRRLNWANPEDIPIYQEIVQRAKAQGVTGFGAGPNYMREGSMHIGYGNPAVWGVGGKGVNAPEWLVSAYGAAPIGTVSRASTGAQPMAQPTAQPQQRGIRGFLANPDKRDRLIMALEGMTLNPNQALIQTAAQGIQDRRAQRAADAKSGRTAEWLRANGRPDLAEAVATGAIDPKSAVSAALTPEKDPRTAKQKDYEFFKGLGMSDEAALAAVSSGTTVNVGGENALPPGVVAIDEKTGLAVVADPESPTGVRQVPIPGGPADIERAKAEAESTQETELSAERKKVLFDNAKAQADAVSSAVSDAMSIMDKKGGLDVLPEAGILGSRLASMGLNQQAVDLSKSLNTVKAAVAFGTLQKMREASKTGGALGAVSAPELALLESALGSLDQSLSEDLLRKNLGIVEKTMTKILNDPVASYYYQNGELPPEGYTGDIPATAQAPQGILSQPAPSAPAPAGSSGKNPYMGMTREQFGQIDIMSLTPEQIDQLMEAQGLQ